MEGLGVQRIRGGGWGGGEREREFVETERVEKEGALIARVSHSVICCWCCSFKGRVNKLKSPYILCNFLNVVLYQFIF
jgi:hypothetical protein